MLAQAHARKSESSRSRTRSRTLSRTLAQPS